MGKVSTYEFALMLQIKQEYLCAINPEGYQTQTV